MKTRIIKNRNQFKGVETYEGETIETKVARVVNNKEPITDGAPIIYTEKKDGVLPDFNVRTDRWEIAIEAMDRVHKAEIAKSVENIKLPEKPDEGSPSVN